MAAFGLLDTEKVPVAVPIVTESRVRTDRPTVELTPLADDELAGPRCAGYRRMMHLCPAGRAGTPDDLERVGLAGARLAGAAVQQAPRRPTLTPSSEPPG